MLASGPRPSSHAHAHAHAHAHVPSYFLCPISLDLMLDPVTLNSGQTFDRTSIERWLDAGHRSCPVTRLPIGDLIPNHVLRRLIQSWCEENEGLGIQRIVTPRQPPCTTKDIPILLSRIASSHSLHAPIHGAGARTVQTLDALQRLNSALLSRPGLCRHLMQAGAIPCLSRLLSTLIAGSMNMVPCPAAISPSRLQTFTFSGSHSPGAAANYNSGLSSARVIREIEEALRLLAAILTKEETVPTGYSCYSSMLAWRCEPEHEDGVASSLASMVASTWRPSMGVETRYSAALVLSRMKAQDMMRRQKVVSGVEGFVPALVDMLREGVAHMAEKQVHVALRLLIQATRDRSLRGTRSPALAAGAIPAIIDALEINTRDCGSCEPDHIIRGKRMGLELGLAALEILCRCADGRAAAAAAGTRLLGMLVECIGPSSYSIGITKLSTRILSLILLRPAASSSSHDAMILSAVELGVFSKAMNVASRFPPSSKTRNAALKIAKSLSHFVPSFL